MNPPPWSKFTTRAATSLFESEIDDAWKLFFLAMLHNRGDGHAPLPRGFVASALGIQSKNVARVVRRARDMGIVQAHSTARCVVLDGVTHGKKDDVYPWCHWHPKRTEKPLRRRDATAKTPLRRRDATDSVSARRRDATAKEGVSAGQGDAPLLLTSPPHAATLEGTRDAHAGR